MDSDAQHRGIVAGIAAYLVWGALTLYWRHLDAFDAFQLIGWRVICSAALMAIVLSISHRWQHLRPVLGDRRRGHPHVQLRPRAVAGAGDRGDVGRVRLSQETRTN